MSLLPQHVDSDSYWRDVYEQPLSFWLPALAHVARSHNLPDEPWTRAPLGRNIVFCAPTTVVKFGPPYWIGEMAREVAALRFVTGQLPIATPAVLASGTLDEWDYVVQTRLPGTLLWKLWPDLLPAARADLAYQHGQLMAAIHAIALNAAPPVLAFDWDAMIAEQRDSCAAEMRAAGVDATLVTQVESYLAATPWSVGAVPSVLLHGDMNHLNFLVSDRSGGWQITGVIDWGDAKIGPPSHEFISPGVHMYKGDRVLLGRWYEGYGLKLDNCRQQYEHVVMVRAMLYYADSFPVLIRTVAGATACQDWASMAHIFWRMAAAPVADEPRRRAGYGSPR